MPLEPGDVAPADADLTRYGVVLDVRPSTIRARSIAGARNVPMDELLADPHSVIPDPATEVLVICDMGMRSKLAARRLTEVGIRADSLSGGIDAWVSAGLPVVTAAGLDPDDLDRYDRHIKLAEFGVAGQQVVGDAAVTVVGAGGLGVPAAQYLAGAGVGRLRIVDDDHIEISNLQRQPAYRTDDVGVRKVTALAARLAELNPVIEIEPRTEKVTGENADRLLVGSDVIVDATDRFDARYAISDAGQRLGIPVVFAAVYRWEGHLAVFEPGGPCYRCIFPDPPVGGAALDCAVTGVLGSVVGTIGTMQASEALRMLVVPDEVDTAGLTLFDARSRSMETVSLRRREGCVGCGTAVPTTR